jgi:hypothetical protein
MVTTLAVGAVAAGEAGWASALAVPLLTAGVVLSRLQAMNVINAAAASGSATWEFMGSPDY